MSSTCSRLVLASFAVLGCAEVERIAPITLATVVSAAEVPELVVRTVDVDCAEIVRESMPGYVPELGDAVELADGRIVAVGVAWERGAERTLVVVKVGEQLKAYPGTPESGFASLSHVTQTRSGELLASGSVYEKDGSEPVRYPALFSITIDSLDVPTVKLERVWDSFPGRGGAIRALEFGGFAMWSWRELPRYMVEGKIDLVSTVSRYADTQGPPRWERAYGPQAARIYSLIPTANGTLLGVGTESHDKVRCTVGYLDPGGALVRRSTVYPPSDRSGYGCVDATEYDDGWALVGTQWHDSGGLQDGLIVFLDRDGLEVFDALTIGTPDEDHRLYGIVGTDAGLVAVGTQFFQGAGSAAWVIHASSATKVESQTALQLGSTTTLREVIVLASGKLGLIGMFQTDGGPWEVYMATADGDGSFCESN
ncbi:MAG: hypothetical protein ACI9OJ_003721 [Myxococcota bacterium]|jgi:hypothetical protein